jgi:hypothetical protein
MKPVRFILFACLWGLSFTNFLTAQQSLKGYIFDASTGNPVEGANISMDKEAVTATDKSGQFILPQAKPPFILKISHISYYPKEILISKLPDDSLTIYLIPKTRDIDEVVVSNKAYFQFFKPKSFFIQDYAIEKGRVWALGYEDKNILKPELHILNLAGKTLDKISVDPKSALFQDPSGTVHLFDSDSIFQLFFDSREIELLYPARLDGTEEVLFNFQVIRGDSIIFRSFNEYHSYCDFIFANAVSGNRDTIFASYNRERFKSATGAQNYSPGKAPDCAIYEAQLQRGGLPTITQLKIENPGYIGMSDKDIIVAENYKLPRKGPEDYGSPLTRQSRTAFTNYAYKRTILNKPIRASVFYSNNLYYVFEGTNLMLWRLAPDFSISGIFNIDMNENAREVNMIQDPTDQSLYISYQIDGSCFVDKIDPVSGLIASTKKIQGFPFAEKVKVYGGRIYFIYQMVSGQRFTNLFSITR